MSTENNELNIEGRNIAPEEVWARLLVWHEIPVKEASGSPILGSWVNDATQVVERLGLLAKNENLSSEGIEELRTQVGELYANEETQAVLTEWYRQRREREWRYDYLTTRGLSNRIRDVNEQLHSLEHSLANTSDKGSWSLKSYNLAKQLASLEILEHQEALQQRTAALSPEGRDFLAYGKYIELKKYRDQADTEGFVWLPHFRDLLADMTQALRNDRWILMIGESGTGKSALANAVARRISGMDPLTIACTPQTSVRQLAVDTAIDSERGSFYQYGPLMAAFTGYDDSLAKGRSCNQGRCVRLDEAYFLGSSAYAVLKEARQKRPATAEEVALYEQTGKINGNGSFYGRPVLRGATAILTTNPPGYRYQGRKGFDAALLREMARFDIDYPPMSHDRPQLYDFMLSQLLDNQGLIPARAGDLQPFYELTEVSDIVGSYIGDRKIVGEYKVVENPTDIRHGILYRYAHVCRAIQTAFVLGNGNKNSEMDGRLKCSIDLDSFVVDNRQQEDLTLNNATITLGEISSVLKAYKESFTQRDLRFRAASLEEWLQNAMRFYISGLEDLVDRQKVLAICNYYNFFNTPECKIPDHLLDPIGIGMLSLTTLQRLVFEEAQRPEDVLMQGDVVVHSVSVEGLNISSNRFARVEVDNGDGELILTQGHAALVEGIPHIIVGTKIGKEGGIVLRQPGKYAVRCIKQHSPWSEGNIWAPESLHIPEALLTTAQSSVNCLKSAGLLVEKDGVFGTLHENNFCPVPTEEQLFQCFRDNTELIQRKFRQGFSTALVVPYGLPPSKYMSAVSARLQALNNGLDNIQGCLVSSDTGEYVYRDAFGPVIDIQPSTLNIDDIFWHPTYFTKSAASTTTRHLMEGFPGYGIILAENFNSVPNSHREVGGRVIPSAQNFDIRKEPDIARLDYFLINDLHNKAVYAGESGLTIHDWLALVSWFAEVRNVFLTTECWTNLLFLGNSLPDGRFLMVNSPKYTAKHVIIPSNGHFPAAGGYSFSFETRNVVRLF